MADLGEIGVSGIVMAGSRTGLFIAGAVTDDNNASAVRIVRIYERDTGKFAGQAISVAGGNFLIETIRNVEHDIVCLDDTAGTTYNDLIHRATPV